MSVPARAVAVAAAALALTVAWMWWHSPERQIRRALAALADGLSHEEVASPLGAVADVAGMQSFLAESVVLEPGRRLPPVSGRTAVLAAAARVRAAVPALRLDFEDLDVNVSEDGATASVRGTITAAITDRAGQQRMDAREFTADMHLVGGHWVVARASVVEALEPVS